MSLCPTCTSPLPPQALSCPACGTPVGGSTLPPGTPLQGGRYRLELLLGQGGFGITYRGVQTVLDLRVAVKEYFPGSAQRRGAQVLLPSGFADAERSFVEEGKTLARFHHPGIVRVIDVFEENSTAYIVMDFLDGESLGARLARGGVFEEAEALRYVKQAGEALGVVHGAGMLHGDIKPDNLVLTRSGQVVLIDFGSAKTFEANKTGNYDRIVTPGYGPLEQYGAQVRRGPYTDVYALAATLYVLLTASVPVPAVDRMQGAALTSPRLLNPSISSRLERTLLWGLELKSSERPQTVAAFLEALTSGVSPKETTRTLPSGTPHLDRAREILETLAKLETEPGGRFTCPSCHRGEMQVVTPAEVCPQCRQEPLLMPGTGSVPCVVCAEGVMELVAPDERPVCPLCTRGELLEPPLPPALRCPACRGAELVNRTPDRRLCPHCREGRLRDRHDERSRCPNCLKGTLSRYTQKRLFGNDTRARCDRCDSDWRVHGAETDPLWTLERSSGRLEPYRKSSKPESGWAALSGRAKEGWVCEGCEAEWDKEAQGYRLAWTSGDNPLSGRVLSVRDWTKLAYRLPPSRGSHLCPACDAEFDLQGGEMRFLASPKGFLKERVGETLPVIGWRRLAGGKTTPDEGLLCTHCGSEWNLEQPNGTPTVRLVHPGGGAARYPNGTRLARSALGLLAQGKRSGKPGARCRRCSAEWDKEGNLYRLLRGGRFEGERHPLEAWRSKAMGRKQGEPGATCRACGAEWLTRGDSWELAEAGKSPRQPSGTRLSIRDWRLLASGKATPGDGYKCGSCGLELNREGTVLRQAHPSPGAAHSEGDWRRLGAGLPLKEDAARLEREGAQHLRAGFVAGEGVLTNDPPFPRALGRHERVLFGLSAESSKKHGADYQPGFAGTLWFTTERLLFDTPLSRPLEFPLHKLRRVSSEGQQLILEQRHKPQAQSFRVRGFRAKQSLGAVRLEVEITTGDLAELLENLRVSTR